MGEIWEHIKSGRVGSKASEKLRANYEIGLAQKNAQKLKYDPIQRKNQIKNRKHYAQYCFLKKKYGNKVWKATVDELYKMDKRYRDLFLN